VDADRSTTNSTIDTLSQCNVLLEKKTHFKAPAMWSYSQNRMYDNNTEHEQ